MAQQLCKVLFANISDEDKEKILYRNAAKLFPCR
jgi:predicted TIM-barrel fold metal-dependent hydrolase